jgi:uncharacterized membrane protein
LAGDPRRWWSRELVHRALREFAAVPIVVVIAFAVLAGASIYGDRTHTPWLAHLRRTVGHFIGSNAASTTLQAVATGLVTVTSITFSVLLLAVQQTASTLSPVVFDQFIRRRINQFLLGFFVGLVLFSYVTLAAVQNKPPPILGAALALGAAAHVLQTYRSLIGRADGTLRQRLCDDIERGHPFLETIPSSRALQVAIAELRSVTGS